MSTIRYCPIHGSPDDPFTAFPCPRPFEEEGQECPYLLEELNLRIREITEDGNYFEVIASTTDGTTLIVQEYRNHHPYGKPKTRKFGQ